ncbi:unnamed protein product [Orchesella dallaii]|uniref:Uncharacterized protein n=1 Tax=Orchesella dallaii TaxID=48710 RepID=A0ABP1Q5Y6_9HEXA
MIAILIQFVYAGFLASFVANEEIRNCKNWMSVTIVTSIIYDICIFPGLVSNHFRELGYFFVVGFTFFKLYELGVVYAFIIEVQRPRIPRPSVTARRLQLAVSQVVSPYAVATTILNTSTNLPTAPPQPQVVLPLPNVVAVDLQPSCPEIQDEPSCIEPLLPYYDEEMSPVETDYVGPQVYGPDFPPPYFETQRQYERTESPPPSYDEANCQSERVVKVSAVIGAVGFWRSLCRVLDNNIVKFILQALMMIDFVILSCLRKDSALFDTMRQEISQRTCKAWLHPTGLDVVFAIVISVASLSGVEFELDIIILICPWVAFKIYEWLTVLSYLEELKGNEGGDVGVVFTNSESRLTEMGQTN